MYVVPLEPLTAGQDEGRPCEVQCDTPSDGMNVSSNVAYGTRDDVNVTDNVAYGTRDGVNVTDNVAYGTCHGV